MPQLGKCLGLDLADPFARDAELPTDLFKRAGTAILETETKPHNLLLPITQLDQDIAHGRGKQVASRNIDRSRRVLVFDEVGKIGFVLVADGRVERQRSRPIRKISRIFSTGSSTSAANSSTVGSRLSSWCICRCTRFTRFIASTMCTGIRIVRAWSAMARVIA